MIHLILAFIVFGILYWALQQYKALPKAKKRAWLIKIGLYSFAAIMLMGVITGRMHWVGALLAGLIAVGRFGLRFLPLLNMLNIQSLFANPVFKTPFLTVQLNLKTGNITGSILSGPHAGENIEQLNANALDELEGFYKNKDNRSYYLIRAIRQRQAQSSQQNSANNQDFSQVSNPAYDEAIQILGLENIAKQRKLSKQDVVKAHRHLIQKLHPDRGGNDYLAARVNQAKDVLLNNIG